MSSARRLLVPFTTIIFMTLSVFTSPARGFDNVAPSIGYDVGAPHHQSAPGHYYGTPETEISLHAEDPSGVALLQYRINSAVWINYTSPITLSVGGPYSFDLRAADTLGNTITWSNTPILTVVTDCWDPDGDGYYFNGGACGPADCDEGNPLINPGATEACNGLDDNCDGSVDEGIILPIFYSDSDGDGYGTPDLTVESCEAPSGYVEDDSDCDDSDPLVNPNAIEAFNLVDDNCDGVIDERFDFDLSGKGAVAYWPLDGNAVDVTGNGYDGTLYGNVGFDAGVRGAAASFDGEGDYIGTAGHVAYDNEFTMCGWFQYWGPGQHDYTIVFIKTGNANLTFQSIGYASAPDPYVHVDVSDFDYPWYVRHFVDLNDDEWHHICGTAKPGEVRLFLDGEMIAEDDLTGLLDHGSFTGNWIGGAPASAQPHGDFSHNGLIDDVIVFDRALSELEVSALASDANLDGIADLWQDNDGDGFDGGEDCDDGDPVIFPGAAESCDAIDNDCDGLVDEDLGTTTCGYGICNHTIPNCVAGVMQVCDPFEGASPEDCDLLDNDCDGDVDEGLGTTTCGLGVCDHTIDNCAGGVWQICDPLEGASTEVFDLLDNDCNGVVDEGFDFDFSGKGAVAYWPLDGNAVDVTGNGYDGTLYGDVGFDTGVLGGAASFDGSDDYIETAGHVAYDDEVTMCGWFLISGPAQKDATLLFYKRANVNLAQQGLAYVHDDEYIHFDISDYDSPWYLRHFVALEQSTWHHICSTAIPGQVRIFLNGALVEEGSQTGTFDQGAFVGNFIGGSPHFYTGGPYSHNGLIDDVIVFDRALSKLEVSALASDANLDGVADLWQDNDGDGFDGDEDCDDGDPAIFPGAVESCDGIDNDCDELIDEDLGTTTCGYGICNHTIPNCVAGVTQVCDPFEGALPEDCDLLDNDCDGDIDEGLGTTTCGLGACEHTIDNCAAGVWQICDPLEGASTEVFDLLDNDCNGVVDEGFNFDLSGKGAVAYWPLDGNAVDVTGNGYDGTLYGDVVFDTGVLGGAASFDGSDDYIETAGHVAYDNEVTMCGWFLISGPAQKDATMLFYKRANVNLAQQGLAYVQDDEYIHFDISDYESPWYLRHFVALEQSTWHHICSTAVPGQVRIYLNGALVEEGSQTGTFDQGAFVGNFIGGSPHFYTGGPYSHNGLIDDVIVFDRALSQLEVSALASDANLDGIADLWQDNDGDGFDGSDDCEDGDPAIFPGAVESCDGIDNDCDGLIDEDLGTTTCGLGVCNHTIDNCVGGVVQACDPMQGASNEVCDLLDNDCDGATDEGLGTTTCGVGVCYHTVDNCVGGVLQTCDPFEGALPEDCDLLDNDCDGEVDELLGTTTCGLGECEHTIDNCVAGVWQDCDPFEGATEEVCDTLDNDCDGITDDAGILVVEAIHHVVGGGNHPDAGKFPLVGLPVGVYDAAEGSCARDICGGISWQYYECVVATCDPLVTGVTDAAGMVTFGIPVGDYLVIGDEGVDRQLGVSASLPTCGDPLRRTLRLLETLNGKVHPAKTTRRTGSELLVIEPEYVEWSGEAELYPFVFESVGEWNVATSVAPPEGFVADYDELAEQVDNELEAVQFTLTDVGSDWVPTGVRQVVRHKGRREVIVSRIGIQVAPGLALAKGLDRHGRPLDADGNPIHGPGVDPRTPRPVEVLGWIEPSEVDPQWVFTIRVDEPIDVTLAVTRGQGLVEKTLFDGELPKGEWQINWDGLTDGGKALNPGLHWLTLTSDNLVQKEVLIGN